MSCTQYFADCKAGFYAFTQLDYLTAVCRNYDITCNTFVINNITSKMYNAPF